MTLSRARGLPWAMTLPLACHTRREGKGTGKKHWALEVLPESPARLPCWEEEAFAALEKDPGLVPSTCTGTYEYLQPQLQEIWYLFWPPLAPGTHVVHRHMCRQNFTCNIK